MSYDLQILRDNPIGYWSLNGTNKDITKNANTLGLSGNYVVPPIIANSGSSLKVNSSTTASIENTGVYECFAQNYDKRTFTIAFWFSLNNQLNGSGAGTYQNNQLTLFSIQNNTTIIGKIVYDYKSNTIRYTFPGTGNTDSYYIVPDFDKQYYIVATYSNGSISLNVNGKAATGGSVIDKSNFATLKTNLRFVVQDTTIPSGSSFIISGIEFYNYQLSIDQIQRHILWAANDEKPNFQATISPYTSLISFFEDPQLVGFSRTISGLDFSNTGQLNKLRVRNDGISALQLDPLIFNNLYDSTASYTINSSSGITFSASSYAGVDIPFIPQYFDINTGFTAYMTINRTSTGSYNEYLFGITNVNGNFLYLEYDVPDGNTNYHLRAYNPYTDTVTSLINLSSGQSYSTAKISNIAINFSASSLTLYTSDNSGQTASLSYSSASGFLPLTMDKNSTMTIGNSYHSAKNFYSYINNFGITDVAIPLISSTPFGSLSTFLVSFQDSTSPFRVKQRGSWIHQIPSVTIPMATYFGTVFDWAGIDNCQLSYSIDSGSTFNVINRYETASLYNTLNVPQNISIKVQIDTDYDLDSNYQTFNNFYYNIYDFPNILSDNTPYTLISGSGKDTTRSNLVFSNGTNNILARQKNFGIKFGGASPTFAQIQVPSGASYSAVEFWYRPDSIVSGSLNYIINSVSGSATTSTLFIDATSKFQVISTSSISLYINGNLTTSGLYTANKNDLYHIVLVLSSPNSSNLYLNGNSLGTGAVRSNGTFGHIQFWDSSYTPSSADILDRYLQFVGKTIYPITDTNTSKLYSTSSSDSYVATLIG
jgi:hypothetical protein